MGVEYRHFLIPRPNPFQPNAQQLVGLVESLARDSWMAPPGSDALRKMALIDQMSVEDADDTWAQIRLRPGFALAPRTLTSQWFEEKLQGDLQLGFPVQHADQIGLQYPLINDSTLPDDPYYEIQLHLGREFVHHTSELIEPAKTTCTCGEQLESWPEGDVFYSSRIRNECPRCSSPFDPSLKEVIVRDGWTGRKSVVMGGTIYRFAVVIDCGKCIPDRKVAPVKAHPSLVALCRRVMGHEFYEVGDFY